MNRRPAGIRISLETGGSFTTGTRADEYWTGFASIPAAAGSRVYLAVLAGLSLPVLWWTCGRGGQTGLGSGAVFFTALYAGRKAITNNHGQLDSFIHKFDWLVHAHTKLFSPGCRKSKARRAWEGIASESPSHWTDQEELLDRFLSLRSTSMCL